MALASVSLSPAQFASALLAPRTASASDLAVVHGMQEVSGSSPLSSTSKLSWA